MRLLALITIAGVSACGPSVGGDDEGGAEGDSTSAGDDTGSASAESAGPTTTPVDTSAEGPMTTPTTNDDGVDDAVDDDDGVDDAVDDDDGGKLDIAGGCDFEQIVRDAAMGSKVPPVDCGFVTLGDDAEAWQAAHQCATEAFASDGAVAVLWELQGTDSTLYGALVGFVGESYGISEYGYDSFGGPIMWARSCGGVVTLDDCVVGTGSMCLTCQDMGDQTAICE